MGSSDRRLLLDASGSANVNLPRSLRSLADLTFVWKCRLTTITDSVVTLSPCADETAGGAPITLPSTPMLAIPAGTLLPGHYQFLLQVGLDGGDNVTATASSTILLQSGEMVPVTLSTPSSVFHNPARRLVIRGGINGSSGSIDSDMNAFAYRWRMYLPVSDTLQPLQLQARNNVAIT